MGDWQKTDKMKDVEEDRERAIQAHKATRLCASVLLLIRLRSSC